MVLLPTDVQLVAFYLEPPENANDVSLMPVQDVESQHLSFPIHPHQSIAMGHTMSLSAKSTRHLKAIFLFV